MEPAAKSDVTPDATSVRPSVAIVLPVRNEAAILEAALSDLFARHDPLEVIVVDGGSRDATRAIAASFSTRHPVRVLEAPAGRAAQMNAGAAAATADILLFLHADTRLPPNALERVRDAIGGGHVWGRFDVRLDGARFAYRVIEWFMNRRSALTGIATGDQAIFVRRDVFESFGGYAPIALMEDIELSCRLKRRGRPARIADAATTSARRWERHGVARTVLRMWGLRLFYRVGVSPARLARWYS
jgi:rSAM/selenodomain-associated transferase 2